MEWAPVLRYGREEIGAYIDKERFKDGDLVTRAWQLEIALAHIKNELEKRMAVEAENG